MRAFFLLTTHLTHQLPQPAVKPQGLLGVMSSGQGSLTNNLGGQRELYRGSKAALHMFMRSFAARPSSASHPLVVMAPGWIRTELGGADAPLTIEETIPRLVNVLLDKRQRPGLEYLDYQGRTVPW
ncbi:TPA: short-chain dehydrogenase [Klebsiella quasipneumoniae subsp. similipneumoniae]|nr:short-chain dehydrogenase [Klebsiella quasipneumoniae subsp. similipneumoniae]